MRKLALFLLLFLFLPTQKSEAQGIDSLNITSTFVTLGESWYTDYFTGYAVYTGRSFFKDANGGLHVVFLANYKLFYCYSEDGLIWNTEQISSLHDGDFREAVIYADSDGNPHIAVTINPYYDYGNPTGITYGDEFRYSVYYFYKEAETWMEEEVYNSTLITGYPGNFGCRVNELYQNMDGEMVLIGSRYGWYTYGGEFWEFTRDTEGNWSDAAMIHVFSDTPIDHATDLGRCYLKSNGERYLVYTRPYNSSGNPELAYMSNTDGNWSAPMVLTTDMINHASWDMSISPDEDMYLIHYSNNPTPHINLYTDFSGATEIPVDLSLLTEIQHAKIKITHDGILDLMVYPPYQTSDEVYVYVSEDYGETWSDPITILRADAPGVLPVTDQYSDQGTDFEYINISRVSSVEPYGPDSLFYNHVEHINTSTLGIEDYGGALEELSMFPNPFWDMVTINYSLREQSELNIRIFTMRGKMVLDKTFQGNAGENQIQMNLNELDPGTYVIEVLELDRSNDISRTATRKLVKL